MPPVQGLDRPAYSFPGMKEWLLGLPILSRLYTSVIVPESEKWPSKETWPTDMSPTAYLLLAAAVPVAVAWSMAVGRCTRGGGDEGGSEGCTTRVLPSTLPVPIFNIF